MGTRSPSSIQSHTARFLAVLLIRQRSCGTPLQTNGFSVIVMPIVKHPRLVGVATAQTSSILRQKSFGRARGGHERGFAPALLPCFSRPVMANAMYKAEKDHQIRKTFLQMRRSNLAQSLALLVSSIGALAARTFASSDLATARPFMRNVMPLEGSP